LLGKRPGDTVKVKFGGNEEDYTVLSISRFADKASS
jgi:transcription elongation GreA/GreB family factor